MNPIEFADWASSLGPIQWSRCCFCLAVASGEVKFRFPTSPNMATPEEYGSEWPIACPEYQRFAGLIKRLVDPSSDFDHALAAWVEVYHEEWTRGSSNRTYQSEDILRDATADFGNEFRWYADLFRFWHWTPVDYEVSV